MRAMALIPASCLAVVALALAIGPAASQRQTARVPTALGAATNFSQGWADATGRAARELPLARIRDSIRWAEVERSPGRYAFDRPTTTWPDRFDNADTRITLTLNWGNPLYDGGDTPHSPAALTAFGRFAAAVVARFPQIDTLEIGNEINGGNFVSGPVKHAGLAMRGRYHLAMVRAAADAVATTRPGVRVIGGSTHSLPAGFLWPLLDQPGAGAIEGLALHPYTTPIDQLPAQIGLLRRRGPAARLPLHITEFGSPDPQRAAADLLRGYATLAALGAAEFDWYPFNERGDGMVPLVRRDGTLTDAGRAFRFVRSTLAGKAAQDASPDPFTEMRMFGPAIAVVWGEPRALSIDAASVTAHDATGARLDPRTLSLAEDRPVVLLGTRPLVAGTHYRFACSTLVADSFRQFGYPLPGRGQAAGDGFDRLAGQDGRQSPFEVLPGQQRAGVLWTPYLGLDSAPGLRLTADTMLPAPGNAVIHRFAAPREGQFRLVARFQPGGDSTDGITVTVQQGGRKVLERSGTAPVAIDLRLPLRQGEALVLTVGARSEARGDTTRYRIRVFDEQRCR